MSTPKRGLGRGLGALIPTAEASTATTEIRQDRPRDLFFGGEASRTSEVPLPTAWFPCLARASHTWTRRRSFPIRASPEPYSMKTL